MLDESTHRLIIDTSHVLDLAPAVVEKDYFVTQMLRVLSEIENEHALLIFAGGTCLAKAHRLVTRMSEDVDFKIQKKISSKNMSKNQYLKMLKIFRENIISGLGKTNLTLKEMVVQNEGQYMRIELEYQSMFGLNTLLRPFLLLEFTSAHVRLPAEKLSIATLMQHTLGANDDSPFSLSCISAEETAAEKWVSLTRRIAASDRGYYREDNTLIRHAYDLSAIHHANVLGDNFFNIIKEVVINDGKQFKNQYPEYFNNPMQEIERSLALLRTQKWEKNYDDFLHDMVYGDKSSYKYENAMILFDELSQKIIKNSIRTVPDQMAKPRRIDNPYDSSTDYG